MSINMWRIFLKELWSIFKVKDHASCTILLIGTTYIYLIHFTPTEIPWKEPFHQNLVIWDFSTRSIISYTPTISSLQSTIPNLIFFSWPVVYILWGISVENSKVWTCMQWLECMTLMQVIDPQVSSPLSTPKEKNFI